MAKGLVSADILNRKMYKSPVQTKDTPKKVLRTIGYADWKFGPVSSDPG